MPLCKGKIQAFRGVLSAETNLSTVLLSYSTVVISAIVRDMNNSIQKTLDEVSDMTHVSKRNIRYYIQEGLVDRPNGAGRDAWYGFDHLQRLITIADLRRQGLSLAQIKLILEGKVKALLPTPQHDAGGIEVWSHISVKDGIELHIQPGRAGLSPEQQRQLLDKLHTILNEVADTQE